MIKKQGWRAFLVPVTERGTVSDVSSVFIPYVVWSAGEPSHLLSLDYPHLSLPVTFRMIRSCNPGVLTRAVRLQWEVIRDAQAHHRSLVPSIPARRVFLERAHHLCIVSEEGRPHQDANLP